MGPAWAGRGEGQFGGGTISYLKTDALESFVRFVLCLALVGRYTGSCRGFALVMETGIEGLKNLCSLLSLQTASAKEFRS